MLDHSPLRRQITPQDGDAAVCSQCLIKRSYNILSGQRNMIPLIKLLQPLLTPLIETVSFQLIQILAQRLTRHGHHVQMQILPYLFHDRRHTARIVEALRRPAARRTHIQKISGVPVQSVEGISRNLQPEFMRDGRNMQQTVGTAGYSCMHQDRILKTVHGDHLAGPHPRHGRQLHRLRPRFPCKSQQIRTGGRHQRTARQRKPQRLRHDLHRGRRTDKRAGPTAGTGVTLRPV